MLIALPVRPALAAAVIALMGVVVRCRFIGEIFVKDGVLPWGADTMYHLWRIEAAVASWLPPRLDPFMNAPDGARVIYPDGFDALLAWVARLAAGADAERFAVQVVAMSAMPLLGGLGVWLTYALARRCVGPGAALIAAALAAILPAHAFLTVLGRVDHHLFEAMIPPLALIALPRVLEEPDRPWWRAAVAPALGLGALGYLVPAAPLHFAVMVVAVWITGLRASAARDQRVHRFFQAAALAAGGAAMLTLPDALTRTGWAAYEPSRLLCGLYAGAAVACALLALAARRGHRVLVLGSLAGVVAGGGLALAFLGGGLGFIAREGTLALVTESRPIWSQPWVAIQENSFLLPLAPVLFLLLAWRAPPARFALGAMGLVGFIFTCLQLRFSVVLLVPLAVASGYAAAKAWRALVRRHPGTRARLAASVGVVLVAALLVGPSLRDYSRTTLLYRQSLSLFSAAMWLKQATPHAGPRTPGAQAPYTVAAQWNTGNLLSYMGRRPVLAGAMYHADYERGLHASLTVLHGDDSDGEQERRKVRYVLVQAGDPTLEPFQRRLMGWRPRPARLTLASQLYHLDGSFSSGKSLPPAKARSRMRLVYDSPYSATQKKGSPPALKIFERVPGALLRGACAPGAERVLARVRPSSNRGRLFTWVTRARCGGGRFAMRLPYAGQVELRGATTAHATIPEAAVRGGAVVEPR